MTRNSDKDKHSNDNINISRVRRAIDFWPEFTGGERLVAGVIADHFNAEEGYAFPSYRYLNFAYGFSSATVSKTVEKLQQGLMRIDRSGGNNQYVPDMRKVESVLADLEAKRSEWKAKKSGQGAARGEAASRRSDALRGEAGASRDEADALRGEAGVLHEVKPNVQPNAQPKAQHKCPTPRAHELVSLVGAGSFLDEADTKSVKTSDCMSKLQQFAFMSQTYQRRFDRQVTDEDRGAFLKASGSVGFELMLMNIIRASPMHSFADCVNARVWRPRDERAAPRANDNQLPPDRKASGIDWENDPPF